MTVHADPTFLGEGWAFPVDVDETGAMRTARYEEDVRQSIRILLGTRRGERLMRPDFGAGLEDFLFEPVDVRTLELVRSRVRESLVRWEARIVVEEVEVRGAPPPASRIDVTMTYRVRATNVRHNLVYPFYLDESGEGRAP